MRVLLIGDSLTHGKAGDWTWRYRLWQHLQVHEPREVDFVGPADDLRDGSQDYRDAEFDHDHASLWGATLSPPAYDPGRLGSVYLPDAVVIELGANDLVQQGEQPADVAATMRGTIEELREAAPGVDVVLVRIPVLAVPGAAELNGLYDVLAEELDDAEERVVVAAAEVGFVADPTAPDADTYDGLHPDESGEIKVAAAVADALAELGLGADG